MIFSSVPVYLDPPDWQQPSNDHQLKNGNFNENSSFPPPPSSSNRPGSMAELARLVKIPQPEVQPKCPRCESSNTKFCYYNNYNLSQPRHFCRTCRRYWTQGGALRNVPVGGGCRRNKKNKSKPSKTSTEIPSSSNLSPTSMPSVNGTRDMINRFQQNPNQFPFISSLQAFSGYGFGSSGDSSNLTEIYSQSPVQGANHQWRSQQFPFLSGFESRVGPCTYQNDGVEAPSSAADATHLQEMTLKSRATRFPPPKVEESRMLNLTRVQPSIGVLNSSRIYDAPAFTDLSGLSSSSTSHFF